MEKVQTLAEFLGVEDPLRPDVPASDAPDPEMSAQDFCRSILNTKQYRESLLRRILMDDLAPAIELRLYDYAHGKPVERMEVKDTTGSLSDVPIEQIERRVSFLQEAIRSLQARQTNGAQPSSDEDVGSSLVH